MQPLPNIDQDKLNVLFPFHFFIDTDLNLISAGKSFLKLKPDAIGKSFDEIFLIKRPKIESVSFRNIIEISGSVILLRSKTNSNLIFRGQFLPFEKENKILFAGAPWVTSSEELNHHKLLLSDFAIHNTITDLVQIMKSNEMVMDDINHLVKSLEKQKQELNSTSTRLSALIQNMHSGILLEDQNRKIILINQTFCNIFGIPANPSQLIGMDCRGSAEQTKSLFIDPEGFVKRIDVILKEKKSVTSEFLYLKDGRILERDFIPVFAGNEYQGHLWQYRDVTEEKTLQEQIKASEEKYKGILENFDLGLIEVDTEERITKVYPRFCTLTGYSETELIGKKATELLYSPKDLNIVETQNSLRKQGLTSVYEVRIKTKNNLPKWVMISGAPIYDLKKNIIGSIGIHWDISERKENEQALKDAKETAEKSARIKQQFLANMSHEIRTPINVILGLSDLLSNSSLNTQQQQDLETIKGSADQLLSIINDILDISKIESGKIDIKKEPFSIRDLSQKLFKQFKPLTDKKGINFVITLNNNIPVYLIGDEYRLQQILSNLISNAVKFTHQGAVEVSIDPERLTSKNCMLRFLIKDSGIGIAEKDHDKIFESFSQASNNNTREYGGTGLGLSIVKELTLMQNGSIKFTSDLNKGSEFQVELPFELSELNEVQISDNINNDESKVLRDKFILLAEDNELNRMVAIRYLEKWGSRFDIAENGDAALINANKNKYDIILMDIQMPLLDGYQATQKIRQDINCINQSTPIIGLTAHAITGEKEKCISNGMNDYLAKPFKPNDLLLKITSAIHENSSRSAKSNYNLNYLKEISFGNQEFFKQSLYVFLNETPKMFNDLKQAYNSNNQADFKFIAHKIKSNFYIVGAEATFKKIENLNNKNNHTKFEEVESDFSLICENIKSELNKLT